jgi:Icc-related predicted phosphoesterase
MINKRKKEIIQDAEKTAKRMIKQNKNDTNTMINMIKQYIGYIKHFGVDSFINLNENALRKLLKNNVDALRDLKETVKARKIKYKDEELLEFLGYLARELTFYK